MNFIWLLGAYLLGSLNYGVLISRLFHKSDIREHGSHGAGSTNMLRTYGMKSALLVFALDIFKPILPMILVLVFQPTAFQGINGGIAWVAVASIIGQCYPLYFHFKGGKGAASTLGFMIFLLPLPLVFATISFLIIVGSTKYVSLATVLSILLGAILSWFIVPHFALPFTISSLIVFWRHKDNIIRLCQGTESKLSRKRT